jgi:oxaloacetate decarboxylase alpha subunit
VSGVSFVDVSVTDGQSAAWSGALETSMLLAPMASLGGARLAAIEVLSPAVLAQCIARGEHPLQRIAALRERAGGTPLRAAVSLLPAHGRCDILAGDLLAGWLRLLARHGVAEVLLVDPLMSAARLREALQLARGAGLTAIAALPYSGDPARDDAYHAAWADRLAAAGASRIMLRDESGLLHLDRAATLIPALRAALGGTPLDFHTRCHTGLGPQVVLEAVRLQVDRIDTALPCVANGASAPSLPLLVRSAKRLGLPIHAPDAERVAEAQARLEAVGGQEGFPESRPWAFDLAPYIHQLPGEVAAEAMRSLRAARTGVYAFAHECEQVRRDLGSPPMLQPFARAIARQALAHVTGTPRYATLEPAIRRILQGVHAELAPLREDLRERVGLVSAPRLASDGVADDAALLARVAGIVPAALPPWRELRYEAMTPEEALVRGLLRRWNSYSVLSVTGPGLAVRLEHSGEAAS